MIDDKILKKLNKNISSDYQIICISYAGGGASFYTEWIKYFNEAEIYAVQLPGHEERYGEEYATSIVSIAKSIADAFEKINNGKHFSIFGHSMGGLIGFELAKVLESRKMLPDCFFVSSTSIEDFTGIVKSVELNDEEFLKRVMMFGGLDRNSEELLYNEYFKIYLNILREDFGIIENYTEDGGKIKTPIYGICGNKDPMESELKMKKWSKSTFSHYVYKEFVGDHFYIKDNLKDLTAYIKKSISAEYKCR